MVNREWWTRQLPLENNRDALARVGFRFLWTTAPFFAIITLFQVWRFPLVRFLAAYVFLIPIAGGAWDWWRLRRRAQLRSGRS